MTPLETATLLAVPVLLILDPVRHVREWWARTRPVGSVEEHHAFLTALGEVVR